MSVLNEFEALKVKLDEQAADATKAEGGNKAAGVRLRKGMQDVKKAADVVRKAVLDAKDDNAGE